MKRQGIDLRLRSLERKPWHGKRIVSIALVNEAPLNNKAFATVYCITKEVADDCKFFDNLVGDVNVTLPGLLEIKNRSQAE